MIVNHEKFGIKRKKYAIPNKIGNISGENIHHVLKTLANNIKIRKTINPK